MANNQMPKTPRFFVDMMSYLHATGHGEYFVRREQDHEDTPTDNEIHYGDIGDLLYCNTSSLLKFQLSGSGNTMFNYKDYGGNKFPTLPIDCLVVLNHNLEGTDWYGGARNSADTDSLFRIKEDANLIDLNSEHNGFTIRLKDETYYTTDASRFYFYFNGSSDNRGQRYMGAYFFGKTWTPNIDPKVTMSREFDGIKVSRTKGGFSHHNINYIGSPLWSGHNAWELWKYQSDPSVVYPNENPDYTQQQMFVEDDKANLGRLGRRKWSISFTHIADYDLHAALEQTNWNSFGGTQTYPDNSGENFTEKGYDNPILQEDNFMSRLWIPTLGGTIPFVFQANTDNNNPDQFAVCTFDRHSISISTLAPNMYSISFSISEVW